MDDKKVSLIWFIIFMAVLIFGSYKIYTTPPDPIVDTKITIIAKVPRLSSSKYPAVHYYFVYRLDDGSTNYFEPRLDDFVTTQVGDQLTYKWKYSRTHPEADCGCLISIWIILILIGIIGSGLFGFLYYSLVKKEKSCFNSSSHLY